MADDLGFYYSHFIGDGVDAGLVDGVAEEAVAELNGYVFYKDRVGFRRFQRVQGVHVIIACSLLKDVDGVVLHVAEVEGVAGHMLCHLQVAIGGTACQHEG